MKLLLLSHDLDAAKEWALEQDLENVFVIDERDLVPHNPAKFELGFLDMDYSRKMIEYMQFMSVSYKAARPMFMLLDMRHQTAVDHITHDVSILLYDGSLSRRICYNPDYKPTHIVKDFGSKMLQKLLQKSS
jgi:hypothetical protein